MLNSLFENSEVKKIRNKTANTLKLQQVISNVGEDIVLATMKLGDYLSAIRADVIVDYENNRGNGRLNMTKVRSIASNYDVNKLGMFTLADWEDGTYKKADAHHRTAALIMKYNGENDIVTFTSEQLDQNISLQIIAKDDFIRVYSGLNANNGHSSRQKVMNTDLGMGAMLKSILDEQTLESVVRENFYTTIARCVYAYIGQFDTSVKESSYASISLDRKLVSSDAGLTVDEFNVVVSKKHKEDIVTALDYINETYHQFAKLNNLSGKSGSLKLNQTARSILRNASLFGFLLWDRLSERRFVTYLTPKNLALRITEKDAQIEREAKSLLNSVSRDNSADKIVAYITTKKRT